MDQWKLFGLRRKRRLALSLLLLTAIARPESELLAGTPSCKIGIPEIAVLVAAHCIQVPADRSQALCAGEAAELNLKDDLVQELAKEVASLRASFASREELAEHLLSLSYWNDCPLGKDLRETMARSGSGLMSFSFGLSAQLDSSLDQALEGALQAQFGASLDLRCEGKDCIHQLEEEEGISGEGAEARAFIRRTATWNLAPEIVAELNRRVELALRASLQARLHEEFTPDVADSLLASVLVKASSFWQRRHTTETSQKISHLRRVCDGDHCDVKWPQAIMACVSKVHEKNLAGQLGGALSGCTNLGDYFLIGSLTLSQMRLSDTNLRLHRLAGISRAPIAYRLRLGLIAQDKLKALNVQFGADVLQLVREKSRALAAAEASFDRDRRQWSRLERRFGAQNASTEAARHNVIRSGNLVTRAREELHNVAKAIAHEEHTAELEFQYLGEQGRASSAALVQFRGPWSPPSNTSPSLPLTPQAIARDYGADGPKRIEWISF